MFICPPEAQNEVFYLCDKLETKNNGNTNMKTKLCLKLSIMNSLHCLFDLPADIDKNSKMQLHITKCNKDSVNEQGRGNCS